MSRRKKEMLPPTYPLTSGKYLMWNQEYAAIPSLIHTVAHVVIVALDIRDNGEPHVIYVVRGEPPIMTACSIEHFRSSCSPYAGEAWATPQGIEEAMQFAIKVIQNTHVAGEYNFQPPHEV